MHLNTRLCTEVHAFFENVTDAGSKSLVCEYALKTNKLLAPKQNKSVIARRSISIKSIKEVNI